MRWARVAASVRSFTATTRTWGTFMRCLSTSLPIRPNPLMATFFMAPSGFQLYRSGTVLSKENPARYAK